METLYKQFQCRFNTTTTIPEFYMDAYLIVVHTDSDTPYGCSLLIYKWEYVEHLSRCDLVLIEYLFSSLSKISTAI